MSLEPFNWPVDPVPCEHCGRSERIICDGDSLTYDGPPPETVMVDEPLRAAAEALLRDLPRCRMCKSAPAVRLTTPAEIHSAEAAWCDACCGADQPEASWAHALRAVVALLRGTGQE